MGYNIHITLADDWTKSEKKPITQKHLSKLGVSFRKGISGVNPKTGAVITQNTDASFFWPSETSKERCMFHLMDGRLVFKYNNDLQIAAAKKIAEKLHAKVQGDEGEIIFEPVMTSSDEKNKKISKLINRVGFWIIPVVVIGQILISYFGE